MDEKLKNQLKSIEDEAGDLLADFAKNLSSQKINGEKTSKRWNSRTKARNSDWNGRRPIFANTTKQCTHFEKCNVCYSGTTDVVIVCRDCKKKLCPCCDVTLHKTDQTHKREVFISSSFTSKKLLPTQFIEKESGGIIYNQGIFYFKKHIFIRTEYDFDCSCCSPLLHPFLLSRLQ